MDDGTSLGVCLHRGQLSNLIGGPTYSVFSKKRRGVRSLDSWHFASSFRTLWWVNCRPFIGKNPCSFKRDEICR
jgi:hypothetical protein